MGNDFTRADLEDVSFVRGIDIDAQRWPSSREYARLDRLAERVARARSDLSQLADPKARREALAALNVFADEATEGQTALFSKRTNIPFPAVRDAIWRALEKDAPTS